MAMKLAEIEVLRELTSVSFWIGENHKAYAFEKANINPMKKINGIQLSRIS